LSLDSDAVASVNKLNILKHGCPTFFWHRATPIIVGWFVDCMCKDTKVIQKVSSVCEYCRCSAAVMMVHMHVEFFDSFSRHGRNLQTFEQCLRNYVKK
jgi:hypothetical protein